MGRRPQRETQAASVASYAICSDRRARISPQRRTTRRRSSHRHRSARRAPSRRARPKARRLRCLVARHRPFLLEASTIASALGVKPGGRTHRDGNRGRSRNRSGSGGAAHLKRATAPAPAKSRAFCFAEGRRKSGPAVHAWIQNVENARTGSLRARMTRPALVSRSTLKGDAAAMCGSTTDGARAMLQTRANTRPNWSHSHRTAS